MVCATGYRLFERGMKLGQMANELNIEDCINGACPWSGKPVSADSLMSYRGATIGFCNPGCRDKFLKASIMFDALIGQSK